MCQCTYETSSTLLLSTSSGLPCPLSPPALHTLLVRTPGKRWKFFREMRNIPHTDARAGASPALVTLISIQPKLSATPVYLIVVGISLSLRIFVVKEQLYANRFVADRNQRIR